MVEGGCPAIRYLNCSRHESEGGGVYKSLNSKACVYFDKVLV